MYLLTITLAFHVDAINIALCIKEKKLVLIILLFIHTVNHLKFLIKSFLSQIEKW